MKNAIIKNLITVIVFFGLPHILILLPYARMEGNLGYVLIYACFSILMGVAGIVALYIVNKSAKARMILTCIILFVVVLFMLINFVVLPLLNTFPGM